MAFTTRKTLLEKVQQGSKVSYEEFYRFYKPFVLSRGRRCGLNLGEAEDLLQEVMLAFFEKSKTFVYDPAKGRFRAYFYTIIKRRSINIIKKRSAPTCQLLENDENLIAESPDDDFLEAWRLHLFYKACDCLKERVESTTYEAFLLCAIQKRKVPEVAALLNITPNSIYVAKNRCIHILREIIQKFEREEGENIL